MDYEIVNLEEKILATLKPVRLSNNDPEISKKVSLLWENFMNKHLEIKNQVTQKPTCTYSNYENNEKGAYDVATGLEISKTDNSNYDFIFSTIPSGKYAKFVVRGPMQKVVSEFWKNLWNMKLPRKFNCDFEEYQTSDPSDAEVHIFISLK